MTIPFVPPCAAKYARQRRIASGDQKAGTAVDPKVFVEVSEHIAELKGRGSYRAYRDDQDAASESLINSASNSTARPTPMPKYVSATEGRPECSSARGGGVPSPGQGDRAGASGAGQELLDLMSMDMGMSGGGERTAVVFRDRGHQLREFPLGLDRVGSGAVLLRVSSQHSTVVQIMTIVDLSTSFLDLP